MYRSLLLIPIAVALAGCGPSGGGSASSSADPVLNAAAGKVIDAAQAKALGCGLLLPLGESIAAIVEKRVGGKGANVALGSDIGQAMCDAKTVADTAAPKGTAQGLIDTPKPIVIDGVTVKFLDAAAVRIVK